jgi:2-oxoisovalerate dehydrogenase E1 component
MLYLIRRFEETVLENFPKGVFSGTTHTYIGQEANAVGVLAHLQPDDIVFSNHRCHGHFLAYGGSPQALFAELMGKVGGVCAGRGGSQHLHWRTFYSNGVQGGIVPVATGLALAQKIMQTRAIALAFLGDGTLGEGVVYEALNMASLWQAPILFVLENNRIAQTTPIELALAGDIEARFQAFGIPTIMLDSSDVQEISQAASTTLADVRRERAPRALILQTYRFGPHSKGDDTRPAEDLQRMRQERDPLNLQASRLPAVEKQAIVNQVDELIQTAFLEASQETYPDTLLSNDSYSTGTNHTTSTYIENSTSKADPERKHRKHATVLDSLNAGIQRAMTVDERVILLGEDVLDPYGGAFKVSRGLSSRYPQRVLTTPISEAGIVGIAGGLALGGLRPVVEIMFGDFLTLTADQIVNHLTKFRWMYNDQVHVPIVIRTPMGGRRGYGPTHSQTLEKMFLGTPGLRVLAPCTLGNPGALIEHTILSTEDPVLFIENKLLYLLPIHNASSLSDFQINSFYNNNSLASSLQGEGSRGNEVAYTLTLRGAPPPAITIAAYGYMAELALQAVLKLAYEFEIFTELYIPVQLAPFELRPLLNSLQRTRRLMTAEEGAYSLGWGAELVARAAEVLGAQLLSVRRLAALDIPVPASSPLEEAVLPGINDIVQAALQVCPKRVV